MGFAPGVHGVVNFEPKFQEYDSSEFNTDGEPRCTSVNGGAEFSLHGTGGSNNTNQTPFYRLL